MALVFVDGFDHNTFADSGATVIPGWDAVFDGGSNGTMAGDAAYARLGSGAGVRLQITSDNFATRHYFQKNIPIATNYTLGIALNMVSESNGTTFIALGDGVVPQVALQVQTNGTILVLGGAFPNNTIFATSTAQLPFGAFHYFELQATCAVSGTVVVKLDGATIINVSGVNTTLGSGNVQFSSVLLGKTSTGNSKCVFYYDDLYVLNPSGTNAWTTTFLGDTRMATMFPNGNGTANQWTPNGAANAWQCVKEVPADNDTTYISNSTIGNEQRFTFPAIPTTNNTVFGVAVVMDHRKDDAAARTIRARTKSGAAVASSGVDIIDPSSYQYDQAYFELDPNTGQQWTAANVNSAEFGVIETG